MNRIREFDRLPIDRLGGAVSLHSPLIEGTTHVCDDTPTSVYGELSDERADATPGADYQHLLLAEWFEYVHQGQARRTCSRKRSRNNEIDSTGNSCQMRILGNSHVLGVRSR